jgi:hypothetical protein
MMEQNRLSHSSRTAILIAILAGLAACEKPLLDDAAPTAVGDSPTDDDVDDSREYELTAADGIQSK